MFTQRIFRDLPAASYDGLVATQGRWEGLCAGDAPLPQVVTQVKTGLGAPPDYDVILAGGTLGILVAAALAQRGWRVLVLERGRLEGRVQEWNIAWEELLNLAHLHLLTIPELEAVVVRRFNPVRVAFGDYQVWVRDVLNLGVSPRLLLAQLAQKFLTWGGHLQEYQGFEQLTVHPDGVTVTTSRGQYTGRLFLDAMGQGSPVVHQCRGRVQPTAVCLVVGTCALGLPELDTGDLMATFTPTAQGCQYFWEAFPAQVGRTSYLFTYVEPTLAAPGPLALFEEYARLLPSYQGVSLENIRFLRALYGLFPSYAEPLVIPVDRVMPVGDAAGVQSPLSFGGFGAMVRHLPRWVTGLDLSLRLDSLSREALARLRPYQPNLAVTGLFQRAMTVPGADPDFPPERITHLLTTVFSQMEGLGPEVLLPFLRDVVQWGGLSQTLLHTAWADPRLIANVATQVGPSALAAWLGHYLALGGYTGLSLLSQVIDPYLAPLAHRAPAWYLEWLTLRQGWLWGAGLETMGPTFAPTTTGGPPAGP